MIVLYFIHPVFGFRVTLVPWREQGFPELKIGLDCGVVNDNRVRYLFLTNSHLDHISNLPQTDDSSQVWCPEKTIDTLQDLKVPKTWTWKKT